MTTTIKFWLSDDSTEILILGDNMKTITIGGSARAFNVVEFAYSNGGYLRGLGNYSPKKFTFTRDDFIRNTEEHHAWNQSRNDVVKWFTKPPTTFIYLNMLYSTNNTTLRTAVYPIEIPEDDFDGNYNQNFSRSFELISPSGIWECTTEITGSTSISSTGEQEVLITNNGVIECAPIFTFTPDSTCSVFQIKLEEGYGFRLEGSFSSGVALAYNMKNGIFSIGGAETDVSNYLISGSPFLFPVTSTYIYFIGCVGTFEYNFCERYV